MFWMVSNTYEHENLWSNTFWVLVSIYLKSLLPKYHEHNCKTHHVGSQKPYFFPTIVWWNNQFHLEYFSISCRYIYVVVCRVFVRAHTNDLIHLHSFARFFSRLMCNDLIQWLFQIGAKSLQYSIRNRYIQRTICFCIWLFFERSISAHLKNSLNETNSYTPKAWWIVWETSGLPTRDTIYTVL